MIATLPLLLLILAGGAEPSAHSEFLRNNREARAARERKDDAAFLRHVIKLQPFVPANPSVRFALARARALNGEGDAALAELAVLARQGFGYKVLDEPAFARLAGVEAFQRVARELLANGGGEATARLQTLTLPDEMRGEAVAWSPASHSFLLGGKGGVYSLGPDGSSSKRLLGQWDAGVLGIRPDPATGTFLACVNHEQAGTSQVVRHRLADGALLATYPLPAAGALCNDIAILPGGGFAVTDTNNGLVFKLKQGRLSAIRLSRPIFLPNGIAVDPSAGRLFVADANGILVHDIAKAESWHLEPETTSIASIDGMIWHKGALIGVQNLSIPARLLQIRPDPAARQAAVAVLLSSPLLSNSATVAAIEDEAFVYTRPAGEGGQDPPMLLRVQL
jgi:hypothetical protein